MVNTFKRGHGFCHQWEFSKDWKASLGVGYNQQSCIQLWHCVVRFAKFNGFRGLPMTLSGGWWVGVFCQAGECLRGQRTEALVRLVWIFTPRHDSPPTFWPPFSSSPSSQAPIIFVLIMMEHHHSPGDQRICSPDLVCLHNTWRDWPNFQGKMVAMRSMVTKNE